MKLAFKDHVKHLILSGFQAMFVATTEENRCETELKAAAEGVAAVPGQPAMRLITWDAHRGFSVTPPNKKNLMDPVEALDSLFGNTTTGEGDDLKVVSKYWGEQSGIFVFRGLHDFFKDGVVRQAIRNLVVGNNLNCPVVPVSKDKEATGYRRPLVVTAPGKDVHKDIAHCFTVVPFALPNEEQLARIFDGLAESIALSGKDQPGAFLTCPPALRERVIQATRGLRERETEDILSMSLRINKGFNPAGSFKMEDGQLNPGVAEVVEDEKSATLQRSEVLSYISADKIATMDEIGGNDVLKAWVKRKATALGPLGRRFKLDPPRGVVLLGPPGTGKSTSAKVIAKVLGLPLLRFNVARLGGSLVGESQQRTEDALNQIDAFDGAVVWIDEAEKFFGGSMDRAGDGGTGRQVFGMINTWLTEHTSRSFVVLTMNRIYGVPEEFLRKGRFDEIFYLALPPAWVRKEILDIHLRKRGVDPSAYDLGGLVADTDEFCGSELEQVVIDARELAVLRRESGAPSLEEMAEVAANIKPLAKTRAEEITAMKTVAEENGQYATSPDQEGARGDGQRKARSIILTS